MYLLQQRKLLVDIKLQKNLNYNQTTQIRRKILKTKGMYQLFVLQISEVFEQYDWRFRKRKVFYDIFVAYLLLNLLPLISSFSSVADPRRFGHTCMADVHSLLFVLSTNNNVWYYLRFKILQIYMFNICSYVAFCSFRYTLGSVCMGKYIPW